MPTIVVTGDNLKVSKSSGKKRGRPKGSTTKRKYDTNYEGRNYNVKRAPGRPKGSKNKKK